MFSGLASMLACGALAIAATAWLCSAARVGTRRVGLVLATLIASYSAGVAFVLFIGSVEADGTLSLRVGGTLSEIAFILVAVSAVLSARWAL
jgi:hypothetical protein